MPDEYLIRKLIAKRKKTRRSREDVAQLVGVSTMTIYRWEKEIPERVSKAVKEQIKQALKKM